MHVLQVFIPFMIFGVLAMLGGLLTLLMPETLGARMPEQVEVRRAMICLRRWAAAGFCESGQHPLECLTGHVHSCRISRGGHSSHYERMWSCMRHGGSRGI